MQIPNLTLAYAVLESREKLENSIVKKVQELENNWLKIKLFTKKGTEDLIIAPEIFFFSTFSMQAKQTSSGFGGFLRKHLEGKKILKAEQHGMDRIIELEFEKYFLILELFAKGNVVLADKGMKTLGVLRREEWKDRELKRGAEYKFPVSRGLNPIQISFEEFLREIEKTDSDIARAVINNFNIAPVFAEEILLESGIKKETKTGQIQKEMLKKIYNKIREFYVPKKEKLSPIIARKGKEEIILPFPLKEAEKIKEFETLNEAFEKSVSLPREEKTINKEFEKKLKELERSLAMQKEAVKKFEERAERNKRSAEEAYSHYVEVKNVLEILKDAKKKGLKKEEILPKLKQFKFVKDFDLKKNSVAIDFE